MTNWYHEPNTDWLIARKSYLTASDFKTIAPLYEAWKESEAKAATDKRFKPESKKKELDDKIKSIFFGKKSLVVNTYETEAMRRGHCLEGEAIRVYCDNTGEKFYHWDDALLFDNMLGTAASPDALDVPQPDGGIAFANNLLGQRHGIEVKCFNEDNHMRNYCAENKMSIDKDILYQIAWELDVMLLEDITVLFYHPGLPDYLMKAYLYTVEDFDDLLQTALDVTMYYIQSCSELEENIPKTSFRSDVLEPELQVKYSW